MPEKNPKNLQRLDYRIDNVNGRVDHTNERIDNSFQQLANELRQSNSNLSHQIQITNIHINKLSDKISSTNRWAIGTIITVIIAIIIDVVGIGIALIH